MANLPGGGGGEEEYDVYFKTQDDTYYKAVTSSWLPRSETVLAPNDTCCEFSYTPGFLRIDYSKNNSSSNKNAIFSMALGQPFEIYKLTKDSFSLSALPATGNYLLVPVSESGKTPGTWNKFIYINYIGTTYPDTTNIEHRTVLLPNIKIASFPV